MWNSTGRIGGHNVPTPLGKIYGVRHIRHNRGGRRNKPMKQQEQYQACLDHAEPWLRTGTCTPSRVLCPCTSGQQRSEKRGKKTSNSDDTTCLRNSRRRQKRATGSGKACTGIRRTKGCKPWISGQNGRKNGEISVYYRNFTSPKSKNTGLLLHRVRHFLP